ncbi:TPA: hypothetical protein EYP66_23320 [Candidatus Poribacteria bacterium]|nr:hypothetical protein [Candidatus Poribacteria bacterium]
MNETILTSIDKQAFLEALEADPEWAFEVLNRLLKRKERAETFREWLGINELAKAIENLAEAQQRTEEQVQALTQRVDTLASQLDTLTSRVDALTSRVDALTSRIDALAEAQQRTEEQVQALTQRVDMLASRIDVLAEAQQKTEQQVNVLTHQVSAMSEVFGPTWEEEARESVAFLLPKSGVRLLTPLEAQEDNEWDGVAEAEWEGRPVQVRMETKVSAGAGRIIRFANRVRSFVTKTGAEIIPIFCGIRLYSGAREEAQRQRIVLVGLREIRNEIPLNIFTITPQDL